MRARGTTWNVEESGLLRQHPATRAIKACLMPRYLISHRSSPSRARSKPVNFPKNRDHLWAELSTGLSHPGPGSLSEPRAVFPGHRVACCCMTVEQETAWCTQDRVDAPRDPWVQLPEAQGRYGGVPCPPSTTCPVTWVCVQPCVAHGYNREDLAESNSETGGVRAVFQVNPTVKRVVQERLLTGRVTQASLRTRSLLGQSYRTSLRTRSLLGQSCRPSLRDEESPRAG